MIWRDRLRILEDVERVSYSHGIPTIGFDDGIAIYSMVQTYGIRYDKILFYEFGGGVGYSSLWIAYALEDSMAGEAHLYTVERDVERAAELSRNLGRAGLKKVRYEVLQRDALEVIRDGDVRFNLAFIDVNKSLYPVMAEELIRYASEGGVALFHNAFYPPPPPDFEDRARAAGWRVNVIPTRLGLYMLIS